MASRLWEPLLFVPVVGVYRCYDAQSCGELKYCIGANEGVVDLGKTSNSSRTEEGEGCR